MIKTGVVSATFRKNSPEQVLDLAIKAGLDGIEWSSDVHILPGDIKKAEKIKELCQKEGKEICGYATYYRLGESQNPEMSFRPIIETAEALGSPLIRIWAGNISSKEVSEGAFFKMAEEAKTLVTMAKQIQSKISFEYHRNTLADSCTGVQSLLGAIPGSQTHWQHSESCSIEENERTIGELLPFITTIHVQHCRNRVYYPLITGEEMWLRYFHQLKKLIGDHYACLEFVKDGSEKQFLEDANTLRAFIARG